MNEEILIPIVFFLALFGMIAVVSRSRARVRERTAKTQAEVQTRLIDKFGSSKEFVEFAQSPSGQKFLMGATEQVRTEPRERILSTIRHSLIWLSLGIGMFVIALSLDVDTRGFKVAGAILISLGMGFLLSSIVSLSLARSWGLIPRQENGSSEITH